MLATQTLQSKKPKNMKIEVQGELGPGVTSKDAILHIIGIHTSNTHTRKCVNSRSVC